VHDSDLAIGTAATSHPVQNQQTENISIEWLTAVKDWAGVMISAQTLIGRILVTKAQYFVL